MLNLLKPQRITTNQHTINSTPTGRCSKEMWKSSWKNKSSRKQEQVDRHHKLQWWFPVRSIHGTKAEHHFCAPGWDYPLSSSPSLVVAASDYCSSMTTCHMCASEPRQHFPVLASSLLAAGWKPLLLNTNLNHLHSAARQTLFRWISLTVGPKSNELLFPPTFLRSLQPWIVLEMRHRFNVHIAPFIAFPSVSQTTQDPLQWHQQWLFTAAFQYESGVSRGCDWFL